MKTVQPVILIAALALAGTAAFASESTQTGNVPLSRKSPLPGEVASPGAVTTDIASPDDYSSSWRTKRSARDASRAQNRLAANQPSPTQPSATSTASSIPTGMPLIAAAGVGAAVATAQNPSAPSAPLAAGGFTVSGANTQNQAPASPEVPTPLPSSAIAPVAQVKAPVPAAIEPVKVYTSMSEAAQAGVDPFAKDTPSLEQQKTAPEMAEKIVVEKPNNALPFGMDKLFKWGEDNYREVGMGLGGLFIFLIVMSTWSRRYKNAKKSY